MRSTDGESGAASGQFDDLRKIAGIGPTLAARLGRAGIARYRDLAALPARRLAELAGVAEGKVIGQDWIGQARRFEDSAGQQEYATFHVELLKADGAVRRTKTRHYQTDTEESWPGWDAARLIAVICRKAALDTAVPPPADNASAPADDASAPAGGPAPAPRLSVDGPRPAGGTFRLAGTPTVVAATLGIAPGDAGLARGVAHDVANDLTSADFTVEVTAESVSDGGRHLLAAASGGVAAGQPASLELTGPPLPAGLYRLAAAITVFGRGHQPGGKPLCSQRSLGAIVHVRPGGTSA